MLELARGLSDNQLKAISELEGRVVRHDGGRLKLEWGTLRRRPAREINDLLWWEEGLLAGFLGVYGFDGAGLELAGMVDPEWRRRGIGSALLERGLALSRGRVTTAPLLVVPRASEGGRALARKHGGVLQHSEHALELRELRGRPGSTEPRTDRPTAVELRPATRADFDTLSALFLDGFGSDFVDRERPLHDARARSLMISLRGEAIGTVRLTREGTRGGVYGFVIGSAHRGRGLGAEALRAACDELIRSGAAVIGLEVAVDNERALRLYTDVGFRPVTTEDYYSMQKPR